MKQCLSKQRWGKETRLVFENPPRFIENQEAAADSIDTIVRHTQAELETSQKNLEAELDLDKAIESQDPRAIEKGFIWHIKSLHRDYFNVEAAFAAPSDALGKARYQRFAERFESRMQSKVWAKLQQIWEEGSLSSGENAIRLPMGQELHALKEEIQQDYAQFDALGKADGHIDPLEMAQLIELSKIEWANHLKSVLEGTQEEAKLRLEALYFLNPKAWERAVPTFAEPLFTQAKQDANEGALIALANALEGNGRIQTFEEAKKHLEQRLIEAGQQGVAATQAFLQTLENALQPDWTLAEQESGLPPEDFMEKRIQKYSPEAFAWKIAYLNGEAKPSAKSDRMLIRFMRGSRKERETLLKRPDQREALFYSLHLTQTAYKTQYETRYRTRGNDPKAKARNEKIKQDGAWLGGLILLGEEAQSIVNHLDQTADFQGRLIPEMEKVQNQSKDRICFPPSTPKRGKLRTPVLSQLAAQGFNARDLTVGGLKVLAGATLLVNSINTINQASGSNFIEKVANGLKDIATFKNPTIQLSLGVMYGARMLQKNPQYFDYFKVDRYEQEGMHVTRKLNRMVDEMDYPSVRRYIHNIYEWRMMADLQEVGPNKAREILKTVRDRRRKEKHGVELLTKKDLEPYVEEGTLSRATFNLMTDSPEHARMRYKFLSTFLESPSSLEVRTLKELTIGKRYINN